MVQVDVLHLIVSLLLNGALVFVLAKILPDSLVRIDKYLSAVLLGGILGLINAYVTPYLIVGTLGVGVVGTVAAESLIPLLIAGLFSFVITALMVKLADWFINGFHATFVGALIFGVLLGILNGIILGSYSF